MGEKIKEMFPLCDEEGNFTGELKERSAVHRDGDLHGGSHIWIMERHDGRIRVLLQKRSDDKDSFPGCYDCSCAGHVDAGESFISTAIRELSEELSAKVDENELEFLFKQRVGGEYIFYGERFANNEVNFVYLLRKHVDIGTLAFQREEIQGLCWKDAEEVLAILRRQDAREAAGERMCTRREAIVYGRMSLRECLKWLSAHLKRLCNGSDIVILIHQIKHHHTLKVL